MPDKKMKSELISGPVVDSKTEAVFKRKGYAIKNRLSQGAFGAVYTAHMIGSDEMCAVKVLDLDKCSDKLKEEHIPRELKALIEVKHDNVVEILDIFRSSHRVYIFMELASHGTIADYLKKNGAVSEKHACVWFRQMLDALGFIHEELHIAHRDIKIENILLDGNDVAKLTDFGFAKESYDVRTEKVVLSRTYCGTEPYHCPQIVMHKPYNPFLADVWALGVVLFAMLNNKFPFHYGDPNQMIKEQRDRNYIKGRFVRKDFSRDYRDLQSKMFAFEEDNRPLIEQVKEHAWVKNKGRPSQR